MANLSVVSQEEDITEEAVVQTRARRRTLLTAQAKGGVVDKRKTSLLLYGGDEAKADQEYRTARRKKKSSGFNLFYTVKVTSGRLRDYLTGRDEKFLTSELDDEFDDDPSPDKKKKDITEQQSKKRLYTSKKAAEARAIINHRIEEANKLIEKLRDNPEQPFCNTSIYACKGETFHHDVWELRLKNEMNKATWNGYQILIAQGKPNIDTVVDSDKRKICQDYLGSAKSDEWECIVLCDGHGRYGDQVARTVCSTLPCAILDNILDRKGAYNENFEKIVANEVFEKAFEKIDREVIWDKQIRNWTWVKVIGGKYAGLLGQVTLPDVEVSEPIPPEKEKLPVTLFLECKRSGRLWRFFGPLPNREDELKIADVKIHRKNLVGQNFLMGGATCVALVRNSDNNRCKIAVAGDSRVLILPGPDSEIDVTDELLVQTTGSPRECFGPIFRSMKKDPFATRAYLTKEHNIASKEERERLIRDFKGKFLVGSSYNGGSSGYLYPNATFQYVGGILPTRGFGDRLYQGSGYTYSPQISKSFKLGPNSVLLGASDGVFDELVWGENMCNLVHYINKMRSKGLKPHNITDRIKRETERRCRDWGMPRVDDISMFYLEVEEQISQEASGSSEDEE